MSFSHERRTSGPHQSVRFAGVGSAGAASSQRKAQPSQGGASSGTYNPFASAMFCESIAASCEVAEVQWEHVLITHGMLSQNDAREIANVFREADLPPPSNDSLVYMTHEFLLSLGVTAPSDRARIMLALERMPPPQPVTRPDATATAGATASTSSLIKTTGPTTYTEDTETVRLHTRRSTDGACVLYDLTGKDHAPEGTTSVYATQLSLLQSHFAEAVDSKSVNVQRKRSTATAAALQQTESTSTLFVAESRPGFSPIEIPVVSAQQSARAGVTSPTKSAHEPSPSTVDDGTRKTIWEILASKTPLPCMVIDSQRTNRIGFILRVCTTGTDIHDTSFGALTNKWVVFADEEQGLVALLHRVDSVVLANMRDKAFPEKGTDFTFHRVIVAVFVAFLDEFEVALDDSSVTLDECESDLLDHTKHDKLIEQLYHLERRASVYERLIDLNRHLVVELGRHFGLSRDIAHLDGRWGRLRDKAVALGDRSQNLLSLLLSLSGHRTNTLMSLLTKFSLVFIPMTFITGVYGMNFVNMPELEFENSYFVLASIMGAALIIGMVLSTKL